MLVLALCLFFVNIAMSGIFIMWYMNASFINSKNRAGLSYRLAINHLADLNDAEMKMMRGRKSSRGYNGGLPFNKTAHNVRDVPDQIDWRLYGTCAVFANVVGCYVTHWSTQRRVCTGPEEIETRHLVNGC